jgi:hypothetical protein
MASPGPDSGPHRPQAPAPDATAKPASGGAVASGAVARVVAPIMRLVLGRPWLLPALYGMAAFAILLALGWFLLISPYSGPADFVYEQF